MGDNDITTGQQLNDFATRHPVLRRYYKDLVINDKFPDIPTNGFIINNKNNHWTAIYKRPGHPIMEYDSYGRDMLPDIKDTKIPISEVQGANGIDSGDCGQRTLAKMIQIFQ